MVLDNNYDGEIQSGAMSGVAFSHGGGDVICCLTALTPVTRTRLAKSQKR